LANTDFSLEEEVETNTGGILVIRKPWPAMLRGIYGDRERYIDTYWSKVPGMYTAGDGARKDENGNFWIMGRIDDVIIVAGHNLGTMEVESALVSHPSVAEAAVVGFPHEIKGTGIAAFVILRTDMPVGDEAEALKKELALHVGKELGPIAKPDQIKLTEALPKTRSGKIMRRLLRDIAAGKAQITQDTIISASIMSSPVLADSKPRSRTRSDLRLIQRPATAARTGCPGPTPKPPPRALRPPWPLGRSPWAPYATVGRSPTAPPRSAPTLYRRSSGPAPSPVPAMQTRRR